MNEIKQKIEPKKYSFQSFMNIKHNSIDVQQINKIATTNKRKLIPTECLLIFCYYI